MAGLQCLKAQWWKVHEPDAPELKIDRATQDLFDQGHQVGRLAQDCFPGGILIDMPYYDYDGKLDATRDAWESGASAVFEASFKADGVFVAVDVLERTSAGPRLVEVKSTSSQKPEHVMDAAVQAHVLRSADVDVTRVEIMHLNRDYRHPDQRNLFARTDVTAKVETALLDVPDEIDRQLLSMRGPCPEVDIGPHCTSPRACPFMNRCWPQDRDHIRSLHNVRAIRVAEYMAREIHRMLDIPDGEALSVINQRQKRAAAENRMIIEPTLGEALAEFEPPIGFLDFETVSRAVPLWDGLGPWRVVPVQFSYHEEALDGSVRHVAWLAEGPGDPRPEIARALLDATAGVEQVLAYSGFEIGRVQELAATLPHLEGPLEALESKIVDLLPVVRDNVYHPDFRGSFSLKAVLPVLVPDLGYDDLEIGDGSLASVEIARMMLKGDSMSEADYTALRGHLLEYCERDTWAMVQMLRALRRIAAEGLHRRDP